jgi:ABC-2 type transport system ATP-binding protein
MIEIRDLTKWYGPILAVDHISLDVPAGRIVGFLGPNGAGKTTTLRILTCFMPATSGAATVDGHDVFTDSAAVRRRIGYLPENTPLYPEMRVTEHLHHFGRLHGMNRADRNRRIGELTERCGLGAIAHRLIGQLSKGNKQRVGLAQALLHDPPVLILDEPTVGLDPAQITAVRQLITELGRDKTILLSTHILPEVEKTCQDVVIIAQGRVAAQGAPDELRRQVSRTARVLVEVQANPSAVEQALGAVASVAKVEAEAREGWCRAAVTPRHADADIRADLAAAVMAKQWAMRELRLEAATLEEFFVQITSTQARAAG